MLRKEAKHIIVHIVFKHLDKDQENQEQVNCGFLCGVIIDKADK